MTMASPNLSSKLAPNTLELDIVKPGKPCPEPDAVPDAVNGQAAAHKIMLVDDSLTVRTVFQRMFAREAGFEIAAQAGTAEQALAILKRQSVDVILLDLEMPGMGGLEAMPKLIEQGAGAAILVVSSLTENGAQETVSALAMGAADTMLKPRPGGFDKEYRETLLGKIRALCGQESEPLAAVPAPNHVPAQPTSNIPAKPPEVLAIGASTGGIHALNQFFRTLPKSFSLPILLTQHLPESFMPVFARQMAMHAGRRAIIADDNMTIEGRTIYIAPGNAHMGVVRRGSYHVTRLDFAAQSSGCMPSADPMFESAAKAYDGAVTGIMLSGMGRDGAAGAKIIHDLGGSLLAQDQASSAVWGMPRSIVDAGLAGFVGEPQDLARQVAELASASQR